MNIVTPGQKVAHKVKEISDMLPREHNFSPLLMKLDQYVV